MKGEYMKLVINGDYGGFCPSYLAQKIYLERLGKECFFYKMDKFENPLRKIDMPDPSKVELSVFVTTIDLGDSVEFSEISDNMLRTHDIERSDKILIEIVEMLGSAASAPFSKLKIVEIPDDVEWEIEEYDGWEYVAEKHRTWA